MAVLQLPTENTGCVHDQKFEGRTGIYSKMPDPFHSGPVSRLWS